MDTGTLLAAVTRLLYSAPLALAGAIVFMGAVLLLIGWRLGRRRVPPPFPEGGEPGGSLTEDALLPMRSLLSPDRERTLPRVEVPPRPPEPAPLPRFAAAPATPPFPRPRGEPPRPAAGRAISPLRESPPWRIRPEEVRSHTFRRRLRGYDPQEVYEYLVAISDELAALQQRMLELRQESQDLQAALNRWREQAGTVQNTLATAQKLAEEMVANAQEEATREAKRIVQDAFERLARLQQEIGHLKEERSRIREEVRSDALAFVTALRDLGADPLPRSHGPRPPAGGPQGPAGP